MTGSLFAGRLRVFFVAATPVRGGFCAVDAVAADAAVDAEDAGGASATVPIALSDAAFILVVPSGIGAPATLTLDDDAFDDDTFDEDPVDATDATDVVE